MNTTPANSNNLLQVFLKRFFQLLYNQWSWAYDWVADITSAGMWKSWVFSTLPYLKGPKILELGTGPGHLLCRLENSPDIQAYGLDISAQMLHMIHKRQQHSCILRSYAQYLPFPECTFNQIVATFPSDYIIDRATLDQIHRVLIIGGQFICIPFAWITGKSIYQRWGRFLYTITGQVPKEWNSDFLKPFIAAGFNTEMHLRHLQTSNVAIIVCTKPSVEEL